MRYTYYKSEEPARPGRSGKLLKYFLGVLIAAVLVTWVVWWNSNQEYQPEKLSEQAFYEGFFAMVTRLDQSLVRRFPQLDFVEAKQGLDGIGSHVFKVNDPHKLRAAELEKIMDSNLGGYGFQIKQSNANTQNWEFEIVRDSSLWAIYRFDLLETEAAPVSILPADIAKVSQRPQIAIVIDDFGYSMNETINGFLDLKKPFTAAVIPGRPYSTQVDERLNARNIQTLIHMPMITVNNTTSEPDYALSDEISDGEITRRLKKARREIPKAVGMNNHQGSGGTQSRKVMSAVADFLNGESMFFLDSRTIAASVVFIADRVGKTRNRDSRLLVWESPQQVVGILFAAGCARLSFVLRRQCDPTDSQVNPWTSSQCRVCHRQSQVQDREARYLDVLVQSDQGLIEPKGMLP